MAKDRTIELKNGASVDIITSLKRAMFNIIDGADEIFDFDPDMVTYIKYKDGSDFWTDGMTSEGKFKKTGIAGAIQSHCNGYTIYGKFRLYNLDDINEEYSPEADTQEKSWFAELVEA